MILSAQSIRSMIYIEPFCERTTVHGMTYGLSSCGYDLRIGNLGTQHSALGGEAIRAITLGPGDFRLVSVLERIALPNDICGMIKDKSSWARRGLAVQNTIVEPGWEGYLTLELTNHECRSIRLEIGQPICQIVFQRLDEPTEQPYDGKYQNQPARPVAAIHGT